MDLISNFIGTISAAQSGNKTDGTNSGIDFNDNTFENILNNQLNKKMEENTFNITENFGIPAGIDIGDLDGTKPIFKIDNDTKLNEIKTTENSNNSQFLNYNKSNDFTASEILTFFSSVFDKKPTITQTIDTGLFSFERKLATNSYGKYARNIVTDLSEFVSDTIKLKS